MNDREEVFERRVRGLVLCLALGESVGRSPADLTSIETVLAGWRRSWRRSPGPSTGVVGTTVGGQPAGYRQSHCWPRVVAPRPPRSAARIQREPDIVEPPATKHGISRPHPLATAGRHRPQQARLPHCAHMWCRCADGDPAVHVATAIGVNVAAHVLAGESLIAPSTQVCLGGPDWAPVMARQSMRAGRRRPQGGASQGTGLRRPRRWNRRGHMAPTPQSVHSSVARTPAASPLWTFGTGTWATVVAGRSTLPLLGGHGRGLATLP